MKIRRKEPTRRLPTSGQWESSADGNDPYYLTIANQLREQLMAGTFKPGQRFYSIRGLIKETKRSLPTVRSALGLLIKDGLLEARQGSGYYVTSKVDSGADRKKGFQNFLAVIPSSTVPDEPWFTGRIGLGMIQAANVDHAVVSFYRRRVHAQFSAENERADLERILAMRPDGIAWLHSFPSDVAVLRELVERKIPLVTTMRRLPGLPLPLVREDDFVYASMVLANFEARGHRRIGIILRSLEDDYFRSKVAAFREVAGSFRVQADEEDFFFMPENNPDPTGDQQVQPLQEFLEARPTMTGLLVLASTGIRPIIKLYDTPFRQELQRRSLVFNILDGVPVPTLPSGESLATIFPPLEKLGEQLVHFLTDAVTRKPHNFQTRLIPVFEQGDSLKSV